MAKHIQFDEFASPQNPNCVACDEMLLDAADGLLSPADQAFFDQHLGTCVRCMEAFTQAQRGAAWLSMLKSPRPEPSAQLMERILSETSGHESVFAAPPQFVPVMPHVIPFAPRPVSKTRFARFVRLMHEPRLAMTAAMAFFSIALTMNLTGVRLDQLHASDLNPMNLRRTWYQTNAQAVRYYDNLRVVRVLESRVDDIRQSNPGPASQPAPVQTQPKPVPSPVPAPAPKKQETPQGSSRRESPLPAPASVLRAGFEVTPESLRQTLVPSYLNMEGRLV
jgi:hypothetical protein